MAINCKLTGAQPQGDSLLLMLLIDLLTLFYVTLCYVVDWMSLRTAWTLSCSRHS